MSRGPVPQKAREESLEIAGRCGHVQRYMHREGNLCELTIMSPGIVRFVTAMRLVRLSSDPRDILHEYATVIGQLRFIASSPSISRELWLRTPHGAWRFFRIPDTGILELDRFGMPLANAILSAGTGTASGIPVPVPVTDAGGDTGNSGTMGSAAEKPAGVNGPALRDGTRPLENMPGPGPGVSPEMGPAPAAAKSGTVFENRRASGLSPAPDIYPAGEGGSAGEPDLSQFPGLNLELIRRFIRWRKTRKKKLPGTADR